MSTSLSPDTSALGEPDDAGRGQKIKPGEWVGAADVCAGPGRTNHSLDVPGGFVCFQDETIFTHFLKGLVMQQM